MRRSAFTIVELLVVITIIVVLLALLAPAMDQAIYQAQLAVCGANLKGVTTGALSYATGNRRLYPYRPSIRDGYWKRPNNLSDTTFDDRPYLRGYVSLPALVDPLCQKIDLDNTKPASHVFAGYNLWFGMRYTGTGGGDGMYRIGDRLGFEGDRLRVLAGDLDLVMPAYPGAYSGHPDETGVLSPQTNQDLNWAGGVDFPTASWASTQYTMSQWTSTQRWDRGATDQNHGFDDGSVTRYVRVLWDEVDQGEQVRMAKLPIHAPNDGFPIAGWWHHMPLR